MKNLSLEIQGVQGKAIKTIEKTGSVLVSCENHRIFIDNFQGKAETYKQRENPLIEIMQDGKTVFCGNFIELIERLKL